MDWGFKTMEGDRFMVGLGTDLGFELDWEIVVEDHGWGCGLD